MSIALVTGASGEIGCAICLELAKEGYDIVAHSNKGDVSSLKDCVEASGRCFYNFAADLTTTEGVNSLADFVEKLGGADVLVNNAGMSIVDVFQCVDPEDAGKLFSLNVSASVELARKCIGSMIKKKNGKIINVSSIWGVYGGSCEVDYSTSKAALIGFTKSLAREVGVSGITVNCVAPGFVNTKMNSHLTEEEKEAFVEDTILGRVIETKEVADVIAFLASEKSNAVSGECIVIGG